MKATIGNATVYIGDAFRLDQDIIDINKIMPIDFYIRHIYQKNLADSFCWKIKNDSTYLYEDRVLNFINVNNIQGENDQNFWSDDFKDLIQSAYKVPGVYIFENKNKKALYVGVSCNLADRIPSSYKERFIHYNRQIYLKCVLCKSGLDAAILEVYFIGKLKPALNTVSKYDGDLTIEVSNIPKFTKRIKCKA